MTTLSQDYSLRYRRALQPIAAATERHLAKEFASTPRIDRISARAKTTERFLAKAEKIEEGKRKYSDPLAQIQDQVGARIVVFYLSDVAVVAEKIEKYFRKVESRNIVPEREAEFGYFGRHYILFLPKEVIPPRLPAGLKPSFFELQIKTLFQHAWSEAEHDFAYKRSGVPLDASAKRRLAFTAAQSWGADQIFEELVSQNGN